ncbi:MAG: hypothetical protein HY074_19140 [Deltaproteobacteria bacterium]|nr:hypothetical protein [Deltaproteobacteria bacterium]
MKKSKIVLLACCIVTFSGCNPLDALNSQIQQTGHIPFQTPLAFSETGTLVGGTPSRLQLVAPPETCFPKTIDGVPTGLRFRDDTALPSTSHMTSVGFDANVKILKGLSAANGTLNAGVNFSHVDKMELNFEGVHIEYMDSIKLTQLYREKMGSLCKDYLDQVAFIVQALQADKMSFKFYSKDGGGLSLSMDNIKGIVDIGVDLKFEITNSVELVITTPKYLGYQLGKLQRSDNGLAFFRSSRTQGDKFVFDPITVFDPPKPLAPLSIEERSLAPFDASPTDFLPLEPGSEIRVQ